MAILLLFVSNIRARWVEWRARRADPLAFRADLLRAVLDRPVTRRHLNLLVFRGHKRTVLAADRPVTRRAATSQRA